MNRSITAKSSLSPSWKQPKRDIAGMNDQNMMYIYATSVYTTQAKVRQYKLPRMMICIKHSNPDRLMASTLHFGHRDSPH